MARGFTAHDVDAAEALSTLAHPHSQPQPQPQPHSAPQPLHARAQQPPQTLQTPRARAHTLGHHTHWAPNTYAQYTATHAAPTHTHTHSARYSAPATLLGHAHAHSSTAGTSRGTGTGTSAAMELDAPPHAFFAEAEAPYATVLHLNAARAPPQAHTLLAGSLAESSNGNGNGNGSNASSSGGGTTRRLVESPSGKPCPNCHAATSTLWRSCALLSGQHYLCNACGLRFKKGKYCPLCTRVYYDADTHAGAFKQCARCGSWAHKHCLARTGALAADELRDQSPFERAAPYTCARCTGANANANVNANANAAVTASARDEGDSDASVDRMQF